MKILNPSLTLAAALLIAVTAGPAAAGTLENLERERALVLKTMLDPSLAPAERQKKVAAAQPRLVDLERMVLRDDSLRGKDTAAVRRAFRNYDLTFLLHASTEKNMAMIDNWMDQVGLSTQSLMATRAGRR